MTALAVENLLALFYTNPGLRKKFEANPDEILVEHDLTIEERSSTDRKFNRMRPSIAGVFGRSDLVEICSLSAHSI